MEELANVKKAVRPHAVLLVVDAMTGQDAVNVAEQFADVADFDGVVLSKLDGDARGGAALSVKAVTGKPIMFASTGEKLDDFERFHPDRMAQRILGMGDVLSFIEKAEQADGRGRGRGARAQAAPERVHARRLPRPAAQDPQDGVADLAAGDDPRARRPPALQDGRRREGVRPHRGDHPLHDADGAPPPGAHQGLAAAADRRGSGTSVQQVNQLVKQFGEMRKHDEGPAVGQDARPRGAHAPALVGHWLRYPAAPSCPSA